MSQAFVIGEDAVACALGTRLIADVLGWTLAQPAVNTRGVSKLKLRLQSLVGLTHLHPVICVADSDGQCVVEIVSAWRPRNAPESFLLRFAVIETESWLMADAEALSKYFDIPESRIPRRPDEVQDAKRAMIDLARRSRKRIIRQEVVSPIDTGKPGLGYNLHLCGFVTQHWRPQEAANRSPSLERAIRRLVEIGAAA